MSTTRRTAPYLPLKDARLGDIINLPDSRRLALRSRCVLPSTAASISGFALLGEFELVLATPSHAEGALGLYVPSSTPTFSPAEQARQHAEGAARYWAPHLQPVENAMGELLYRVFEVRGSLDPHIVLYRSGEPIFFVKVASVPADSVSVTAMVDHAGPGPQVKEAWTPLSGQKASAPVPSLYEKAVART